MRSVVLICLMAMMAAAVFGRHHDDEQKKIDTHFGECFCWSNASNDFCNGNDFQNSEPCQKLAAETFGWLPVYLIAALATLFFPCCFYASRCCCNCCGGRHATRGCCCANESSRAEFPGYSNRQILCTKLTFTALFLGTIALGVHVFVQNAYLSPDVLDVVRDVNNTFVLYESTLSSADAAVKAFEAAPYGGVVTSDMTTRVSHVASKASKELHNAFDIIKDVKHAEVWARSPVTYHVPAVALGLLLITFIMMLFNLRKAVGVMMVLTCISLFTVMTLAAFNGTLAVVTHVVCQNFQTAENVVVGEMRAAGACDNAGFVSDFTQIKSGALQLIQDSRTPLCQDVQTACNALPNGCSVTTCSNGASYNTPTRVQTATTLFEASLLIAQIAGDIASVDSVAARNVIGMRKAFSAAATAEMSFPFVTTCGPLVNVLRTQLKPDLCDDGVNHRSATVSAFSGGMAATLFFAIIFQIRGMKRFRARNTYREYDLIADETTNLAAPVVCVANIYYEDPRPQQEVHGVVIPIQEVSCGGGYGSIHDRR